MLLGSRRERCNESIGLVDLRADVLDIHGLRCILSVALNGKRNMGTSFAVLYHIAIVIRLNEASAYFKQSSSERRLADLQTKALVRRSSVSHRSRCVSRQDMFEAEKEDMISRRDKSSAFSRWHQCTPAYKRARNGSLQ